MRPANEPRFNPFRVSRQAGALQSMGRPHAALELLADAVGQEPENSYLHRAMSRAFSQLDRYDDAIAAAELAISYKPDGWLMHTALALAYINAYRHGDAVAPALAAVRLQPDVSYPHAWAGEALRGVGELAGALERAQSASQIAPERHRPLMARVFLSLTRWRESEEECERAYRQYPEDGYISYIHGLALMAQGRPEEAAALQRSVLRRQPSNLLSRLLMERIQGSQPHGFPDDPSFVLDLEAELHSERIALLRAEVEKQEPGGPHGPGRPIPPPVGR
jgi:tetratricopeptide (TPR) repeat protein